jgi:hypothetical protein
MKQVEIYELPAQIGNGEKYTIRRGGVELGVFLPYVKPDPERERTEIEATRRRIAWLRANDMVDATILDNLERTLPNLRPADTSAAAEPVAIASHQADGGDGAISARAEHLGPRQDRPTTYPAPSSKASSELLARMLPTQIDIRDLLVQTDDEIRTGPSLIVERDGEIVGHLIPSRPRPDPEELAREWARLDRLIDASLRNGYTREQLAEDMDLSKPFRDVL